MEQRLAALFHGYELGIPAVWLSYGHGRLKCRVRSTALTPAVRLVPECIMWRGKVALQGARETMASGKASGKMGRP